MEYKVSELAQKAAVTKRTIHYYISKGLLMPPEGSGVASVYDDSHLERILLIKKLQAQYMPLNKIREYILNGGDAETPNVLPAANEKSFDKKPTTANNTSDSDIYIRENIFNIFEMHYSQENGEKYRHIIENVRNYVAKMLED